MLHEADIAIGEVDAIAATAGPGLIGGVMVGLLAGKGLALSAGKPLIAVNHLEGHALSPRLVDAKLDFPYLLLLASGGHCQLLEVRGVGDYRRLATTIDDAAGEAFDKAAKLLGLGYPGGPAIEALARDGDPQGGAAAAPAGRDQGTAFQLRRPQGRGAARGGQRRTSARRYRRQLPAGGGRLLRRPHQARARSVAMRRAWSSPAGSRPTPRFARRCKQLAEDQGRRFSVPPGWLCTDNAAMIGWAGAERFAAGLVDGLDVPARARWPLDPEGEKVQGRGGEGMTIEKLAVIGGGAWGTALAQVAATGGRETLLWALEDDVVAAVNRIHENPVYLKGIEARSGDPRDQQFLRPGRGATPGWW